jgi:hypothetical protein
VGTTEWALVVSVLSLAFAGVSLAVSFTALRRDRYILITRGAIYESEPGRWAVSLTAANAGKRPITLTFVLVRPGGDPLHSRQFSHAGPIEIPVGGTASTIISHGDPLYLWASLDELKKYAFSIQDALGKNHTVTLDPR